MDDLSRLTTHMKPDKDYRRQHEPGIGYVCPRADGYGGREGVIPPGIAAQRGLIPKGMREVSNDAVSRRAKEAAAECRPDAERYAEYYARGAKEAAARAPARPAAPAPARPAPPAPARPAARTTTPVPRPPVRPAPVLKKAAAKRPASARNPQKTGPKKASRVFPQEAREAGDPETLDGFYDQLRGVGYGTRESEGAWPEDEGNAGGGSGEGVPAAPAPRVRGARAADPEPELDAAGGEYPADPDLQPAPAPDPETDRILETVEAIARERDDARRAYDELARDYAVLEERLKAAACPKPETHETVRVQLGAEPEKMKVGGRDVLGDVWEVRLMGHLDYSREGDECVLTILDPAAGSEVLAQLQPGEVVVLTKDGRTPCAYSGICDKIYGSPDSSDFITCIRLKVTGETA